MIPFHKLYQSLNLLNESGQEIPLHSACQYRSECWNDAFDRCPPEDQGWSSITRPWVGPRYEELRLVVVGENFNEYGGLEALVELTEEAKVLIAEGWRRVRFGNSFKNYAGSFLWHRIGCYATAFGEAFGIAKSNWDNNGYPEAKDAASAYDLITFVEHIKCSPRGHKSKPTSRMWENCGAHVLRKELLLLNPTHILVLGTSTNAWSLRQHVFDSDWCDKVQVGSVTHAKTLLDGNILMVWVVPHPTSYGGSAGAIIQDLRTALASS
jgi:hypothetical protein